MQLKFQLIFFLIITLNSVAQINEQPLLNIGDPAPKLNKIKWIKGTPIQEFTKGKIYVLEFWATWCGPCKAAMPHLSELALKYKDKVVILGIDIYETKSTSMETVKAFVDSLGNKMNYNVAADDSNFMVDKWLIASEEKTKGIPRTFVINEKGQLAWIGHPKDLEPVLSKIVNQTWDIQKAKTKRNSDKYLDSLDNETIGDLNLYKPIPGKQDSTLLMISEIIKKEPQLQYAPRTAQKTFFALIKVDTHKAYEYGKVAIITPTYEEPAYYGIITSIKWYSNKVILPAEIYQLGAEAYRLQINEIPYPEIDGIYEQYAQMAEWYWLAKDSLNAIQAQKKAIVWLKSKNDLSTKELKEFQSKLKLYSSL